MIQKKRIIHSIIVTGLAVLILYVVWAFAGSPTKVAFLNYQVITMGRISAANDNSSIRLYEMTPEDAYKAGRYDILLINGMGLRITEEQRAIIQRAADRGLPVFTSMATNPANDINTLDKTDKETIDAYLTGGGPANYRNMLLYIRRCMDGKKIHAPEPSPAQEYMAVRG